jgi:hypothetical protein
MPIQRMVLLCYHYASASTLLYETACTRGPWTSGQMDGKEQPFFLHTIVTSLAILVTKAFLTPELGQRGESYEGVDKEMPDGAETPTSPKRVFSIILLYLSSTKWHPDHIRLSILSFQIYFCPSSCSAFSSNPRFLMVNPGKFASRIGHC